MTAGLTISQQPRCCAALLPAQQTGITQCRVRWPSGPLLPARPSRRGLVSRCLIHPPLDSLEDVTRHRQSRNTFDDEIKEKSRVYRRTVSTACGHALFLWCFAPSTVSGDEGLQIPRSEFTCGPLTHSVAAVLRCESVRWIKGLFAAPFPLAAGLQLGDVGGAQEHIAVQPPFVWHAEVSIKTL